MADPRGPSGIELDRVAPDLDPAAAEADADAREYLTRLFVCVKLAMQFDVQNDVFHGPCQRLAEIANKIRGRSDGLAALQFLANGIHCNRQLIKISAATFEQGRYLHGLFAALGVGEVAAAGETGEKDWLGFLAAVKQAVAGASELLGAQLGAIRLRPVLTRVTPEETVVVTERFRALRAYAVLATTLRGEIAKLQTRKRSQVVRVKRSVQELVTVLRDSEALVLSLTLLRRHKQGLHYHLANCVTLALVVGRRLGLGRNELSALGLEAAYHDIGRSLTAEGAGDEDVAAASIARLVGIGVGRAAVGRIVVASEVRRGVEPDGSYPFAPAAASRLIAIAHAYDRLTATAMRADEALRVILAEAGRRYDPLAARLFVNAIGVYPMGSLVALASGEVAVVMETPREPHLASRPRVKIVRDATGVMLDGYVVDLAEESGRHILGCLDEQTDSLNPPAFLLA